MVSSLGPTVKPLVPEYDETGQSAVIGIRPDCCEHQIDIRRARVAYESLCSVQRKSASLTRSEQRSGTNSKGRAFLLDADCAKLFAFDQRWQILRLLGFAAPECDGVGEQGVAVDDGGNGGTGVRQGLNDLDMAHEAGAGHT